MSGVCKDDHSAINHINFVTDTLHDLTNDLYESLMDRDIDDAKEASENLLKVITDLIENFSDDI
tara:strand:- start:222 stop:413 length:192 start_codon:yes stop_codon:yes gene_type:complete